MSPLFFKHVLPFAAASFLDFRWLCYRLLSFSLHAAPPLSTRSNSWCSAKWILIIIACILPILDESGGYSYTGNFHLSNSSSIWSHDSMPRRSRITSLSLECLLRNVNKKMFTLTVSVQSKLTSTCRMPRYHERDDPFADVDGWSDMLQSARRARLCYRLLRSEVNNSQ